MKNNKVVITLLLCLAALGLRAQQLQEGVSEELAAQRRANISNVFYELTFDIPADQGTPVRGKAVITFDLLDKADVTLDFEGRYSGTCSINNKKRPAEQRQKHIVLPGKFVKPGTNTVEIDFTSLDEALSRHKDYIYTMLTPGKAATLYPCFNQPDLKGRYLTTINVALSN